MFLSSLYGVSDEDKRVTDAGTVRTGTYGRYRCGGPCDWVVSRQSLEGVADVFSLPYRGQGHLYVYSFFSDDAAIEGTGLWRLLQRHGAMPGATVLRANDVPEYVVLAEARLPRFDHETEEHLSEADPDALGGTTEYASLGEEQPANIPRNEALSPSLSLSGSDE